MGEWRTNARKGQVGKGEIRVITKKAAIDDNQRAILLEKSGEQYGSHPRGQEAGVFVHQLSISICLWLWATPRSIHSGVIPAC